MKHNNRDIQWCITHECYDEVINNTHIEIENNRPTSCEGPFAETEPPQLEENWQDHLTEPTTWELCVMSVEGLTLQSQALGMEDCETNLMQ